MKKLSRVFALTLTLLVMVTSVSVFADETMTPEERFEERNEKFLEKRDERIARAEERLIELEEKRFERQSRSLDIITEFAPDMFEAYEIGFETHNELHELLFETHKSVRENMFDEAMEEMEELKDELFEKAEAGEMTYREVREQLIEAHKANRMELEAFRLEIDEALADVRAKEEIDREERLVLKEQLITAIRTENNESAEEIIIELYDYLLSHIEFDQYKLDVISSYID